MQCPFIEELVTVSIGSTHFQPLSWTLRMKIALGSAKGLAFLHNAEQQVIHRDFKSGNILLDSVGNSLANFNLDLTRF